MRTITTILAILPLLFGFGCDAPDDIDTLELDALELDEVTDVQRSEANAELDPEQLGEFDWTEAPGGPEASSELDEITPPPSKGTCGGYWESSGYAQFQSCGSCTHTIPNPDRPGRIGTFYKRWCWTGGWGCNGCEAWQVTGWSCYDDCG